MCESHIPHPRTHIKYKIEMTQWARTGAWRDMPKEQNTVAGRHTQTRVRQEKTSKPFHRGHILVCGYRYPVLVFHFCAHPFFPAVVDTTAAAAVVLFVVDVVVATAAS